MKRGGEFESLADTDGVVGSSTSSSTTSAKGPAPRPLSRKQLSAAMICVVNRVGHVMRPQR